MHLATVNGAAASVTCLARSIGAAISGSMFHIGLTTGYIGIPFWILSVIAAAGATLSWFLRDKPWNIVQLCNNEDYSMGKMPQVLILSKFQVSNLVTCVGPCERRLHGIKLALDRAD